jgi:two-component system, NtrC family, sensor kinase
MSPARRVSGTVTRVFRTLRFQLIAIVVVTVATVLIAEQWVDTNLSERALERDLKERGVLYLRTVDSLLGRTGTEALRRELVAIVEGDRELTAIDVLKRRAGRFESVLTTRPPSESAAASLSPSAEALILRDGFAQVDVPGHDGAITWRMAMPVVRGGAVVGAMQVDFSLAEIYRLERTLRWTGFGLLASSIVLISLLLAFFLERRVARPVAALVDPMRRAESGELEARAQVPGGGEFAFLAGSFNRMLGRIEDLTAGLESRVRRATHDLAEKNRELALANEKLWRAQLEVGRSERLAALGQMAATIAHELGTPLNSVLGYTQLLQREELPPDQVAKLAVIESQVQRMIDTIRSVLDRTRDRELRRDPVAVAPLVSESLALVSTRLVGRELAVRNEIPRDLPVVPGDAVALRQVLINLLANAIDATEPPGTITVAAVVLAPNGRGRQLEVSIADSGHGMTSDEARRVFEPFYTTKAPGRGTGLGLAIVDHIVRAHGGQVVVESELGQGTTMRVRLPLEA